MMSADPGAFIFLVIETASEFILPLFITVKSAIATVK